jgi:hypothetical protein
MPDWLTDWLTEWGLCQGLRNRWASNRARRTYPQVSKSSLLGNREGRSSQVKFKTLFGGRWHLQIHVATGAFVSKASGDSTTVRLVYPGLSDELAGRDRRNPAPSHTQSYRW